MNAHYDDDRRRYDDTMSSCLCLAGIHKNYWGWFRFAYKVGPHLDAMDDMDRSLAACLLDMGLGRYGPVRETSQVRLQWAAAVIRRRRQSFSLVFSA